MKFLAAVALALVMLWVPVDGVAQTQAEREMLQLYESRERQLLASIDPEADLQQVRSHAFGCLSMRLARTGRPGEARQEAECTAAGRGGSTDERTLFNSTRSQFHTRSFASTE